ncbi:unnamed protein product [Spirodela intermedia]|uniref:Uncharacterized protein n=1 Tax=Spirodela intermedia TaxID=51605 RepID=A0ABN7ECI3_SPIIN|nr:unnamed protein product [Spirodela intermedia]
MRGVNSMVNSLLEKGRRRGSIDDVSYITLEGQPVELVLDCCDVLLLR